MSLVTSDERPLRAVVFLVFTVAAWHTVTLAGRMDAAMAHGGRPDDEHDVDAWAG